MTTNEGNPREEQRYRRAYEATLSEIQSVREQDFVGITLDIAAMVTTVTGRWSKIKPMRAELNDTWRRFDLKLFDKVETYALALGHAQTLYKTMNEPPQSLVALADTAMAKRNVLLCAVNLLIARGLIHPSALSGLEGADAYQHVASDLFALANILTVRASAIPDAPIKPAELVEAEILADQLQTAIGERDHERTQRTPSDLSRNRQAAFTLLINAYEEVRAAIKYLRRKQGDADKIIPSLYKSHGIRKKKQAKDDLDENQSEVTTQPSAAVPTSTPANDVARDAVGPNGPFMM
jgi:hypothetical protein